MGKIAVFLVWGLLGLMLLSACGSRVPASVARDLIHSLEDQDRAGLQRAYCSSTLAELGSRGRGRVHFQDMSYLERGRQNNTANVEIRGTATSASGTTSIYWQLAMKKRGAGWCVQSVLNVGHA